MPQNKDFALRIEILDECLRNNRRNWTLEKLVEEVNKTLDERYNKTTSKRTIQNDIKHLIEEKNAPIAKKKEGSVTYFYYLDSTFSIKNLPIQEEDITLLKDAINILSQVNEFQILRDVDEIIRKLQNTISTDSEKTPSIIQFERHTTSIGTENIDNIFTAIKSKIALRIIYQPFKAEEPEQCIFHPYLLKEYRNRWFLIGRKDDTKLITTLALDRIKSIKNSNQDFIANDLFEPDIYYNNLIGVTIPDGAEIEAIEIKITAKQVPYVKTKPIHYTQEIIEEYENGDITIRLWLINNYELRAVLLSFGCDIEIIKPSTLRQAIMEIFIKAATHYK